MTELLIKLPIGQKAFIKSINTDYVTKERLESLGMIEGVAITNIRNSPLGNPRVYKCLNTLVALRNEIAKQITVEVPDKHEQRN